MNTFIIPMAGMSSRFFQAGYNIPKYMLPVGNDTMFSWAVSSFKNYFDTAHFLFVVRDIFETPAFVLEQCKQMGILHAEIVVLAAETEGQADTVAQGLRGSTQLNSESQIFIFNIDSRRHNYKIPDICQRCDGYLEVFQEDGDHWSFIKPGPRNTVLQTTEKEKISNLCSDGLYFFKNSNLFLSTFDQAWYKKYISRGEYYVAPLYNQLITQNYLILYDLINRYEIDFCGTPSEYQNLTMLKEAE